MENIIISNANRKRLTESMITSMFRLRNDVFHDELAWDVSVSSGYEADSFDLHDVGYAVYERGGVVLGCWRALPTIGPYMLKDVFPYLARGEEIPEKDDIVEISRFAVAKHSRVNGTTRALRSNVTKELLAASAYYAERNAIPAYVAVVSTKFERLLKLAGFNIRRFGDGKATIIGDVETVACWLEMDVFTRRRVKDLNAGSSLNTQIA